jgi:hypothetical protein
MTVAADATGKLAKAGRPQFYVWIAGLCVLIAVAGFFPTFWLPVAQRTFKANPIVYIHAFAMTGWTIFLLAQSRFVASGNVRRHRAMGMIGISYATAIVLLGALMVLNSTRVAPAEFHEQALRFSIVSLSGLAYLAVAFVVAFANTHQPEVHKRLIFGATIFALEAAVARWFLVFLAPPGAVGPPPVEISLGPGFVVDLILVGLMIYDWRTRGRVHATYLITVPIIVAIQVLIVPLSKTDGWLAFATAFERLAG